MMKNTLTVLMLLVVAVTQAYSQSRIVGDKYTFSGGNFPNSFGTTYDPVLVPRGQEFFDFDSLELDGDEWEGDPVELTFDGIEEPAGGLLINERVMKWDGRPNGIFGIQASGIDGETEFDLLDWENSGEILEFSMQTADGEWLADEIAENSFFSMIGLDWANSDAGQQPFFFEQGFYFYYTENGVPVTGYQTQLEDIGLLVGEHPFDESVDEVVYIAYSRNQVDEVAKTYEGGFHMTGGTTQLDADASWALLLQTMGIEPTTQNGIHWGMLVEPPSGPDVTFDTGDVNFDGEIDVADINALTQAIIDGRTEDVYDMNGDSSVDAEDRRVWVEEIKKTYFGDANLDLEFNSGDFVVVFTASQYEDGVAMNSTWETGDWNGDLEFDSGDFVTAFTSAGYEKGPRPVAVPEPSALALLLIGLISFRLRRG